MGTNKSNTYWRFVSVFIVVLVLSLPFYSANAMASSLSVTHNSGSDNIEGYLNAETDTWTLEVEIGNLEDGMEVSPEQVILDVSGSQIEFSSCSGDALATTCEFQSVLSDGITQGAYAFTVSLYDLIVDPSDDTITELGSQLASDTDSVIADGSEPTVSFTSLEQVDDDIYLDFEINDVPSGACVGIDTIEIIDSDSGSILDTIQMESQGDCSFDYTADTETSGLLQASLTGEGRRFLKIRATDLLGHSKTSAAKSVETDFVAPVVDSSSLSLEDFGEYISTFKQDSDVAINITECNYPSSVTATSDQIEFHSQEATCLSVDSVQCIWECRWTNLAVTPDGSTVSASVTAVDEFANEQVTTVSQTFDSDTTAPSIVSFGTESIYDDLSYIPAGEETTLYLYISESGSGIDQSDIIASLGSIGGTSTNLPDYCEKDLSGTADFVCVWTPRNSESSGSTTSREISLLTLEDRVGNTADTSTYQVIIDGVAPTVYQTELSGISAAGQKSFFQSNDDLLIEMQIAEGSGLVVYVDANDIVMDAQTKYQYGVTNEDGVYTPHSTWEGWAKFDQDSCSRDSDTGLWDCQFNVGSIKSGHDASASVEIIVMDTAGNVAQTWPENEYDSKNAINGEAGDYDIEIYALDEETQPDFWEQSLSVGTQEGFVNLDVASLYNARAYHKVILKSDVGADASLIELGECSTDEGGPIVQRTILLSTFSEPVSNPGLNILMEFEAFDPETIVEFEDLVGQEEFVSKTLEYTCESRVYSILDDTALAHHEDQSVTLQIEFAYSTVGALDENVEDYVIALVNKGSFQFLDRIKVLNKIMNWVRFGANIINLAISAYTVFQAITGNADALRTTAAGAGIATAVCGGGTVAKASTGKIIGKIGPVLEMIACNPQTAQGFYADYQRTVLRTYNAWKSGTIVGSGFGLLDADFIPFINSQTLYDNIWVSSIGLCLPGVLFNLEKLRQTYCMEAYCLLEQVAQGSMTVTSCNVLGELLRCKYWWGELVGTLIPFTSLFEEIYGIMRNALANPLNLAPVGIIVACGVSCPTSGNGANFCENAGIVFAFVHLVSNVVGVVQQAPTINYDLCKEIGVDRKYGESQTSPDSVTTDDVTASESTTDSAEAAEA